jgi:hypothetical protein
MERDDGNLMMAEYVDLLIAKIQELKPGIKIPSVDKLVECGLSDLTVEEAAKDYVEGNRVKRKEGGMKGSQE